MSSITASPTTTRNSNIDVAIPVQSTLAKTVAALEEEDDDELSTEDINRLLREAEDRMRGVTSAVATTNGPAVNSIRLPKLDPGSYLPKPPIQHGAVSRISNRSAMLPTGEMKLADNTMDAQPAVLSGKKKSKDALPSTTGPKWFDMPLTDLTSTVKRDMQIIKARNVLDPHRHYRKDTSALPAYSQIGTLIEGNTEFHSSRILRKDRKKTIVDEILADGTSRDRFKRKYDELQKGKKSGKKDFYKKLKAQRTSKLGA